MWDFMQMVLPGEGYWTHYHTESLLNEPFTDQNGNPTKWSIKYSNETAQGHGYPDFRSIRLALSPKFRRTVRLTMKKVTQHVLHGILTTILVKFTMIRISVIFSKSIVRRKIDL